MLLSSPLHQAYGRSDSVQTCHTIDLDKNIPSVLVKFAIFHAVNEKIILAVLRAPVVAPFIKKKSAPRLKRARALYSPIPRVRVYLAMAPCTGDRAGRQGFVDSSGK